MGLCVSASAYACIQKQVLNFLHAIVSVYLPVCVCACQFSFECARACVFVAFRVSVRLVVPLLSAEPP